MLITSASFAYPKVDGALRASLVRALDDWLPPPSTFVLATCLRIEVAAPGDSDHLVGMLTDLFGEEMAPAVVRQGEAATAHLYRVAAGLESPIVGELEVLAQFRKAVAEMRERAAVDGSFLKLVEGAVAAGREARSSLDTRPHDTMAALAAQMVGAAPQVAVLGSGVMASAVAKSLLGLPAPPDVVLLSRSPGRAAKNGVEVWHLSRLEEALATFPAVVSATAASSGLMDAAALDAVTADRERPLTLVDMAMPPDFVAAPMVEYIGIDDLASLARRRASNEAADELVAAVAEEAHRLYRDHNLVGPVIADLVAIADSAVAAAVARFAPRLASADDRELLQQAVHTAARAIVARPVAAVRRSHDPGVVDTIASAFRRHE